MEIKTKLGVLTVQPSGDSLYPGIYLCLKRENTVQPICLLEVDQTEENDPCLNAIVWDPEEIDGEYVFKMSSPKEIVDKMFYEEESHEEV